LWAYRYFTKSSKPSKEQTSALFNSLLQSTKPDEPANAYYSPWMLDQLWWAWEKNTARELQMLLIHDRPSTGFSNTMSSAWMEIKDPATGASRWQRYIKVFAPELWNEFAEDYYSTDPVARQRAKDGFALAMVHEIQHIRSHGPDFFVDNLPQDVRIDEEVRVYSLVVINGARPLLLQGKSLEMDYLQIDALLRSCSDQWTQCPALREDIALRTRISRATRK
jgi:hypothetical protein